jgi:hypothetical protein
VSATPTPQAGDPVRALEALEKHFTLPQGDNDTRLQMLGYIATVKQAVPPSPMVPAVKDLIDLMDEAQDAISKAIGCSDGTCIKCRLAQAVQGLRALPSVPRKEGE